MILLLVSNHTLHVSFYFTKDCLTRLYVLLLAREVLPKSICAEFACEVREVKSSYPSAIIAFSA
ncbi:unnamed protein product [Acanthoscelides obtectus]|uniref:Uncharacterized protein n=1 Tax=Acanthoscelides obtectus TaxID=200917 RepID=A0A9P0K0V5_ACAOB|nr:unnamed protein product [Acanthoscelides obtectus]CAK1654032.1 hypothetical protein AOBTE_LOCUS18433 [Acanthoscelides obtectus]